MAVFLTLIFALSLFWLAFTGKLPLRSLFLIISAVLAVLYLVGDPPEKNPSQDEQSQSSDDKESFDDDAPAGISQ